MVLFLISNIHTSGIIQCGLGMLDLWALVT